MIFNKFIKRKQDSWEENKQYLKSVADLKLLPEQVIYVEGSFNKKINKILRKKYNEISSKLNLFADFVYLPMVAKQLQDSNTLWSYILNYYFPNVDNNKTFRDASVVSQTDSISHLLFSFLGYENHIHPGFFRYMGKDNESFFIYEYFSFDSSNKRLILNQIDYYIDTISHKPEFSCQTSVEEEIIHFGDEFNAEENFVDSQKEEPFLENLFQRRIHKEDTPKQSLLKPYYEQTEKRKIENKPNELVFFPPKQAASSPFDEKKSYSKKYSHQEHELVSKLKSDIQNLKELGLYELLIKEIGSILFENEANKMFQPSRLVMNEDFKIVLPDFNNMEIEMTPLPKSLFILFLRHPQGINLKLLIDYKKELLEIYKLLSYRETYFGIVDSIDRICNPFEGSINEKLSRIKEAFLRRMSMDTAKYYIVTGERGMKKKIEIDRSLIRLPKAFDEIGLTKEMDARYYLHQ